MLARGEPGRRFEARYWRKRQARNSGLQRLAWVAAGVVLFVVGLLLSVFPPAALVVLLAGFACLAQESLAVARALDRFELSLRRLWLRLHD